MRLVIEPKRLVLYSRATPQVLAVLTMLEGRRVWLKGGTPGLAVERSGHNLDVLRGLPGVVVVDETPTPAPGSTGGPSPVAPGDLGPSEAHPTYRPATDQYPHQIAALTKMRGRRVFALFMEQGTGKTKTLIDWMGELLEDRAITGALIVSKKGAHRQWIESEMPRHAPFKFNGQFWPMKELAPYRPATLEAVAFNWDGIKAKRGFEMAKAFCERHKGRLLIIADESQEMKNARSDRWLTMAALKPFSSHRALATGTPIAKDLTDEYNQLKWLDEDIIGIKYLQSFRNTYCIMGGFEGRQVVGQKNIELFKQKTDPHIFRVTKAQIGILPKQYGEWVFDLTKEQKEMIREIRAELKLTIEQGEFTAANGAVALSKVQQISCGFLIDAEKKIHRLMPLEKNPRMIAISEWSDTIDGKLALWFRFREEGKLLEELMDAIGRTRVSYHGGTSDRDRKDAITSFLDPNGANAFIGHPQSAGAGLNLQGGCNNVGYSSNSFSAIDRWQSEDRFHRIGTNGIVTYTDFIGRGSADRAVSRNLLRKKGTSDLVLDDIRRIIEEDWS